MKNIKAFNDIYVNTLAAIKLISMNDYLFFNKSHKCQ